MKVVKYTARHGSKPSQFVEVSNGDQYLMDIRVNPADVFTFTHRRPHSKRVAMQVELTLSELRAMLAAAEADNARLFAKRTDVKKELIKGRWFVTVGDVLFGDYATAAEADAAIGVTA